MPSPKTVFASVAFTSLFHVGLLVWFGYMHLFGILNGNVDDALLHVYMALLILAVLLFAVVMLVLKPAGDAYFDYYAVPVTFVALGQVGYSALRLWLVQNVFTFPDKKRRALFTRLMIIQLLAALVGFAICVRFLNTMPHSPPLSHRVKHMQAFLERTQGYSTPPQVKGILSSAKLYTTK